MKKLLLITLILAVVVLTGCEEGKTVNPTETVVPTAMEIPVATEQPTTQNGYTDEELVEMAIQYRKERSLYVPSIVEVDGEKDGIVNIHLYDMGPDATATTDWYSVDRITAKGTNVLEQPIDLNDHGSLKVNPDKEWIYDAEYEKDVIQDSYKTEYDEEYFVKDIIVPYININSEDAKKANEEIKKVFDDALDCYKAGIEDKLTYVDECGYKSYARNGILSVILTFGHGATDVVYPDYYAYCFDLTTGNQLDYKKICDWAGVSEKSLYEKVENAITEHSKELVPEGEDFDKYNNLSLDYYKKAVEDGKIQAFIGEGDTLNIITKMHFPAGREERFEIIQVK